MVISQFFVHRRIASTVNEHYHKYYEFHYLISGNGFFECSGKKQNISAGTFFFVAPNEKHRLILNKNRDHMTKYRFLCEMQELDREIENILKTNISENRFIKIGKNKRYFFEELRQKISSKNEMLIQSGLHQFISFLYNININTNTKNKELISSHDRVYIEKALKIMHDSINSRITLKNISKQLNLNQSYFLRLFKTRVGIPPMKYLTRLKIESACSLLLETDLPIYQIAYKLHFTDEFYFSKTFKQWMGVSPKFYRRKNKL